MRTKCKWFVALLLGSLMFAVLGSSTAEARGIHRYVHRHHAPYVVQHVVPRHHVYVNPRVYVAPGVNVVAPGVRVGVGYGARVYAYPGVRVSIGSPYRGFYYGW